MLSTLSAHDLDRVFLFFFFTFTNFLSRYYLLSISPAAALAALQLPSVATVGAAVAAARAAPGGPPTPVGGVLVAGSSTALGRRVGRYSTMYSTGIFSPCYVIFAKISSRSRTTI